jgi:hypothetical protein
MKPDLKFIINKKEEKKYLKYIHDNFDKKTDYTKSTKKQDINLVENNWKKIQNKFFSFSEKYCGFKWKYKRYYAILSDITNYSFASPLKEHQNRILIDLKNKKFANRIICHELLHHYFAQIYNGEEQSEDIVHELFVTHMLFDTNLSKLFNDNITIRKNLLWAGHRRAYELYNKSKKFWNNKKNIKDYIKKILKELK